MTCKWECIENMVWVGPVILAESDGPVRDQERSESEGVTHQEIPHHQLSVLDIEGTFTSTPPFGFHVCCLGCSHVDL
jgi:hypothetical protein